MTRPKLNYVWTDQQTIVWKAISFKTDVTLSHSINCNISLTRNNSDTSVSYFAKNECKYQYVHQKKCKTIEQNYHNLQENKRTYNLPLKKVTLNYRTWSLTKMLLMKFPSTLPVVKNVTVLRITIWKSFLCYTDMFVTSSGLDISSVVAEY